MNIPTAFLVSTALLSGLAFSQIGPSDATVTDSNESLAAKRDSAATFGSATAPKDAPDSEFRGQGELLTDCKWETTQDGSANPGKDVFASCGAWRTVVSGGCVCDLTNMGEACAVSAPYEGLAPGNLPDNNNYVDGISPNGGWTCRSSEEQQFSIVQAHVLCCQQD